MPLLQDSEILIYGPVVQTITGLFGRQTLFSCNPVIFARLINNHNFHEQESNTDDPGWLGYR